MERSKPCLTFLGTGAAWGVPELKCDCLICREMWRLGEARSRPAFLLSHHSRLLLDCGPDIRQQLARHRVDSIGGLLISHEHGDHYMGLDDLFAYKRNVPRGDFQPIAVYMTAACWETVGRRFAYLEDLGVIRVHTVAPGRWFEHAEYRVFPFKTEHGAFARGAVGYLVRTAGLSVVYTSDFMTLPAFPQEIREPDYLLIQSFWLNEPQENRPRHMSFQRALAYLERFRPRRCTYLVHLGDADTVAGDPANVYAKKYAVRDPLKSPADGAPYPVPLNQAQWQATVDQILRDRGLPFPVKVPWDGLEVEL